MRIVPTTLPTLLSLALVVGAACGSPAPQVSDERRSDELAPPLSAQLSQEAADEKERAAASNGAGIAPESGSDRKSSSRVLAWVNGEVLTYRHVLQRIGPQISVLAEESERDALEETELLKLIRETVRFHAARDAGVRARPDEIDAERRAQVRELERVGATLDDFLDERGMTRREFDEDMRRRIASDKFLLAAVGRGGPGSLVRAKVDTYVSPVEVRKFYDRNPGAFRRPAQARVRMLTIKPPTYDAKGLEIGRKRAQEAHARLVAGEDFVPVFRELCETGENAVDDPLDGLMTILKNDREHASWIVDFAFAHEKGHISDVERHGRTFYVMLAEGSEEARQVPYDEVQIQLREHLAAVKRTAAAYEVELQLLEEASVRPEYIRTKLRSSLSRARRKVLEEKDF